MKITIGTAQFGLDYGISNSKGKVDTKEVEAILIYAQEKKIDTLDTAVLYGNAHHILGKIGVENFQIITKIPNPPHECTDIRGWVEKQLVTTLEALKVGSLNAVLSHSEGNFLNSNGIEFYETLVHLKKQNLFSHIGISTYKTVTALQTSRKFDIDICQFPLNILDQRFIKTATAEELNQAGIRLHARSIFLQGLLLMPPNERPEWTKKWKKNFDDYENKLEMHNTETRLGNCLDFVSKQPLIDKIVIGIESKSQLKEIISLLENKAIRSTKNFLSCSDENLINPTFWPKSP